MNKYLFFKDFFMNKYLLNVSAKEKISYFGFPTLKIRNSSDENESISKKFYENELKNMETRNFLTKSQKISHYPKGINNVKPN